MTRLRRTTARQAKPHVAIAETPAEIRRCFEVMRELRTHFHDVEEFVERVARQQKDGYMLAFVEAGAKFAPSPVTDSLESLFAGKFLYVDDLVTRASDRSRGFGTQLFDWLLEEARAHGCADMQLDSGVQRFDAHRFYLMKRMKIASYHFSIKLEP